MSEYMTLIFWAAVLVIMALAEAATAQLVAIWFVAGALVAFIASLFGAVFWLQCVLFIATAVILLCCTRPLVKKYLNGKRIPTNSDMNIGKTGTVISPIIKDSLTGRVMIEGLDWMAISENDENIEKGQKIIVKDIQGVKLIVSPVN